MNQPDLPPELPTREMANQIFWTLLLQGIWLLAFSLLVIIFPPALFIMVSITSFWIGLTLLLLAWRVRRYRPSGPRQPAAQP